MSNYQSLNPGDIFKLFDDPNFPGSEKIMRFVTPKMEPVFVALNKLNNPNLKQYYLQHMKSVIELLINRYKKHGNQLDIYKLVRRIDYYCAILLEKIYNNSYFLEHQKPRNMINRLIRNVKGGRRTRKNRRNKRKTSKKSRANRKRSSSHRRRN